MSVIKELIRKEADGTLSFGNYLLESKKKVLDYEVMGDLYKVKTFHEITKLEKNGMLLYESVPGTTVHNLNISENDIIFCVEGQEDAQVTFELEPEREYKLIVDNVLVGKVKANLGGKIIFSVECQNQLKKIELKKL